MDYVVNQFIDKRGRLMLLAEHRRRLGITTDTRLQVTYTKYGIIIMKKMPKCIICGVRESIDDEMCKECIDRFRRG